MLIFWYWKIETWTLIVAVVALMQPWIVAIWRRFFKAGAVDIYETALIEVGYSGFGATIGLLGTLRSRDRDLFIQSIHLTLIKLNNGSQHQFDWAAFRSAKTIIGQSGEVSIDAPSSFMIATAQPHRYNIVFFDTKHFQEIHPTLENYRRSWIAFIRENNQTDILEKLSNIPPDRETMEILKRAYDNFSVLPVQASASTILDGVFPWEPGTYKLIFHVRTARPDRHYSKTWSFTLLKDDIDILHANNITTILEEVCGMQTVGQYNFIYAPYT